MSSEHASAGRHETPQAVHHELPLYELNELWQHLRSQVPQEQQAPSTEAHLFFSART